MNSDAARKIKKLRGIKSKISQRHWRTGGLEHRKNIRYAVPAQVKLDFLLKCVELQESMRDAIIKLLRFYVWNQGVYRLLPESPKYRSFKNLLVMCIPASTMMTFKAQCINQQESMPDALTGLLRYYVQNNGVPEGPPTPTRFTRYDEKTDERRRTFRIARRGVYPRTIRQSLHRRLDTA